MALASKELVALAGKELVALASKGRLVSAELLAAALEYAERGWYPHPIKTGTKRPALSGWTHREGEKTRKGAAGTATRNAEILQSRFSRAGGVGVATGLSRLLVLDLDVGLNKKGEYENGIEEWAKQGIELPDTLTQITGGGGMQLFFNCEPIEKTNQAGLAPGIDIRAAGGQVVMPPSVHIDTGEEYQWFDDLVPVADAPPELVAWILAKINGKAAPKKKKKADGARNTDLTSHAGKLRNRGLDGDTLYAALQKRNRDEYDPPLEEEEVRKITDSVSGYAAYTDDELGDATRLVDSHGSEFRYVVEQKRWLIWDEAAGVWSPDTEGLGVHWRVYEVCREMRAAAALENNEYYAELAEKRAKRIANKAARLVSAARHFGQVQVRPEELDIEHWRLNVANGTVDLRSGELEKSNRGHFFTRRSDAEYDATAECPRWERFIEEVFAGDREIIRYVQRAVGYTLTGDMREQAFFLCYGHGKNGKSVFIKVVQQLMGGFGVTAPPGLLLAKRGGAGHPADINQLRGRRFAVAAEMDGDRSMPLDSGRIKQLTGGDVISARGMNENFSDYQATAKIWATANRQPNVRDDSSGMWRRMHLIPFNQRFDGSAEDKELEKKLLAELPGILSWAIIGCLEWQEHGLAVPQVMQDVAGAYREQEDWLTPFFEESCLMGGEHQCSRRELAAAYRMWCSREGENPVNKQIFTKAVSEREGIESIKVRGERRWRGVAVQGNHLALVAEK